MKITRSTVYSILFCTVLGAVPLSQLVSELVRGERVQAADILVDTFLTPNRRHHSLMKMCGELADTLRRADSLSVKPELPEELFETVETAFYKAVAIRQRLVEVNRHVRDSASPLLPPADSTIRQMELLRSALAGDSRAEVREGCTASLNSAEDLFSLLDRTNGMADALRRVTHTLFRVTLFNSAYLRAYEDELEERSILAQTVRPVMQIVRYVLLRDAGSKVIAGRDGWLFYRPGVEYLYRPSIYDQRSRNVDYNDVAVEDDPVAVMADFKRQLASRGIDLLVVIVPGKGSVYPDMLNERIPPDTVSEFSPSVPLMARLRRHGIAVTDLFGPFRKERMNDSLHGDSLYMAKDTHWRSRGLRLAAYHVARAIKKHGWYDDPHTLVSYSMDTVTVKRTGDVGTMTGLTGSSVGRFRISFEPEMVTCFPIRHNYLNESGEITKRVAFRNDFKRSRILVLGDSFSRIYQTDAPGGAGWIAHLAYELSEPVGSLVNDGGASTLVREKLVRNMKVLKDKRLVVWEFVERDLRYGESGWKMLSLP